MSRLERAFQRARAEKRAALITYLMSGDPDLDASREAALACLRGGADILELGMPFSDPIADGPTIQRAGERALRSGTTLVTCLELAASLRALADAPIVLMGYANPVFSFGLEAFVSRAVRAGVDAVILPDLPPEEAVEFRELAARAGLQTVFLVAPTSTEARSRAACEAATGFVYLVSVAGVTGARDAVGSEVAGQLASLRSLSPVPVVVGFGISTPAQAAALGPHADGVVVGSAIVSRIAEPGPSSPRVEAFVRSLESALSKLNP